MKQKLYGNTRRLNMIFCICLAVLTVLILVLRLSVFREMASSPEAVVETLETSHLRYNMNRVIYFSKPTAKGNILIENLSDDNYYMSVDIIDPQTKNSYLYTGFIEPGATMTSSTLTKPLENGVYAFTAVVSAYDENRDLLGKDEVDVTLYIGVEPGQNPDSE